MDIKQQVKQLAKQNNWVLTPELEAKLVAFIKLQQGQK
jgi:hypothetical protein